MNNSPPMLILCFARSGGTLLSRILKSHPDVVFASEVNFVTGATPDNKAVPSCMALKQQMKDWYGIKLLEGNFISSVEQTLEYCTAHKKRLILRDWTYIDYFPSRLNNYSPTFSPTTLLKLKKMGRGFRVIALIRDAIDVHLSMKQDIGLFGDSYLRYVQDLKKYEVPLLKYEDLVSNPKGTIDQIDRRMGTDFKMYMERWVDTWDITGDVQQGMRSRGIRAREIKVLRRKWISRHGREIINNNSSLREANLLLGYSPDYENGNNQTRFGAVGEKLKNRWYGVFRK